MCACEFICECGHACAMAHTWMSEDMLRCLGLPSTLFKQRLLLFATADARLAGS